MISNPFRGTPEWENARGLINKSNLAKLRVIVDENTHFIDADARRLFGRKLRFWAVDAVSRRDERFRQVNRRPKSRLRNDLPSKALELDLNELRGVSADPTPVEQRKALEAFAHELADVMAGIARAQKALCQMDSHTYAGLYTNLSWPIADGGDPAELSPCPTSADYSAPAAHIASRQRLRRAWVHELMLAHQRLAPLRKAVESRTKQLAVVKKGPKAHVAHREAVKGLWLLWREVTGERPGSSRTRGTPFYRFAHAAMKIVWPGIQSLAGTIGKVCIEMRTLVP